MATTQDAVKTAITNELSRIDWAAWPHTGCSINRLVAALDNACISASRTTITKTVKAMVADGAVRVVRQQHRAGGNAGSTPETYALNKESK